MKRTSVTLPMQQLTKAELVQLIVSSLDSLDQQGIDLSDYMSQLIVGRLKKNLPHLKSSLEEKGNKTLTKEINQALTLRNQQFTAASNMLKAYRYSNDKDMAAAYQLLRPLFERYKDIKTVNMEKGLALADSFLVTLEKEKYAQAIETLGMTDFVTRFKAQQKILYQLYLQRSQESSLQTKTVVKGIKKVMAANYTTLYQYAHMRADMDPEGDGLTMVHVLNEIRKEYAFNIKHRKHQKARSLTEENEGDVETL